MKTLSVHEAKTRLAAVLADVKQKGETFLICRNGPPVADLVPSCEKDPAQASPGIAAHPHSV